MMHLELSSVRQERKVKTSLWKQPDKFSYKITFTYHTTQQFHSLQCTQRKWKTYVNTSVPIRRWRDKPVTVVECCFVRKGVNYQHGGISATLFPVWRKPGTASVHCVIPCVCNATKGKSLVTESKQIPKCRRGEGSDHNGAPSWWKYPLTLWGVIEMSQILIGVLVTGLYSFVEAQHNVLPMWTPFLVHTVRQTPQAHSESTELRKAHGKYQPVCSFLWKCYAFSILGIRIVFLLLKKFNAFLW